MRQTNDREGTWQLVTAIVIASVLALLVWNLAIRDVGAAPVEDAASAAYTCYVYPVTLHNVHCTLGWCSAYEDVHINGRSAVTVYVSGWRLRNGMIRPVTLCR
jgi:hypothetical protein